MKLPMVGICYPQRVCKLQNCGLTRNNHDLIRLFTQCFLSSHPSHSLADLHEMVCLDNGRLQISELLWLVHLLQSKWLRCLVTLANCRGNASGFRIFLESWPEAPQIKPMRLLRARFCSEKAENIGHETPKLKLKDWNQFCPAWLLFAALNT